ncbi:MAG: septum formation initiator family protein [Bacteroidota bacterium]|jgi:cell division protein DivIC|nr:septum formation initiator family protein [Bacteroidota bacterium]MEC7851253.1 septum formation initiator family protein [Bacteroidota bacterium]MEC8702309.1 septum formation initiator family protein [Bacteroidota bacterium]
MISQKIRGLFKNFYFLFFLCFVLWMTIIDSNGFINRYRLSDKLSELNSQKEFYVKEIDKVSLDKERFESDQELLEKYAREEYLMKKESEDIFYVIKE